MTGQNLLDILLAYDFREMTLKYYADRYSESDLTNIYYECQKRVFKKNRCSVTFHYGCIDFNCATGMDGCSHSNSLKYLSIEEVTMFLLLSELKGTQRYIFNDYRHDFKSLYTKLQTEMYNSVPSCKKERVLKLQAEAQRIYTSLLEIVV